MANVSKEEAATLRQMIKFHDPEFYFVPTPRLIELVSKGEHPKVKTLPDFIKIMFLNNPPDPVSISSILVLKYINGSIDENNKFLFDNGVLRVIDNTFTIGKEDC